MNTIEFLRQIYVYNAWANERELGVLKESNDADGARFFYHILLAEKFWLKRILENADTTGYNFWLEATVEDCEKLLNENKEAYNAFFADLTEEKLEQTANYKNSKGVEYTNTYREIFTHVFFHSAYHRGQITSALRAGNATPAYIDFIGFLRDI